MCHPVLIQLMEVTAATDSFASTTTTTTSTTSHHRPNSILRVQQQQQHCDDSPTTTTTTSSSPVPLVLALANAGKRVFEPQRVISDYHADNILRFASPSNAFIKTYGRNILSYNIYSPSASILFIYQNARATRSSSACLISSLYYSQICI